MHVVDRFLLEREVSIRVYSIEVSPLMR
jgi:hypothetical protein